MVIPTPVRLACLVLRAWFTLAAFDLILLAGFQQAHGWIRRSTVKTPRDPNVADADITWAVDEACVWFVKRVHCLQRSAVVTRLLRRHGIGADLVIGYRPTPFESHAWVEVDGRIVNDRPQYRKFFAVLERL